MSLGLVGRKVGMTRVFSDDGVSTPVTVIEVESNRVSHRRRSPTAATRHANSTLPSPARPATALS